MKHVLRLIGCAIASFCIGFVGIIVLLVFGTPTVAYARVRARRNR